MAQDTAWFEGAVHPDRVRSLLNRDVAEFASGQLRLLRCEIRHLRSAPVDGYWTATYSLTVAEPAAAGRTLIAHGTLIPPEAPAPSWTADATPIGADGWRCYLPELRLELHAEKAAAGLPALPLLTDPQQAPALLESILRTCGPEYDDLRLMAVTPGVTGFKPGLRCTVLCQLDYPEGADQHHLPKVVVKLHHDETGQRVHRVMQALWASPLGSSDHVTIAQPLAYLPEWRLLVQGWVPGDRTLKDLLHETLLHESAAASTELAGVMRMAGRALAEVHRCGVRDGASVTWSAELGALRKKHAKLAAVVPQIADLGYSALERLEAAAAATPPDPSVPAHHSFRPSEVLIADGHLGFIDFDNFCQAEPASDLASFTTKVKHAGMNKLLEHRDDAEELVIDDDTRQTRMSRTDAICADFLGGYTEHASVSHRRLALWEALELFALTLSAAKKAMPARIDNCAFMLEHHLRQHDL
jgi:Ser/Thr protein kinase RdoA (MazF antagonist)